jgi:hypothetical protein
VAPASLSVLNYDLLQTVSLDSGLSKEELVQINELHRADKADRPDRAKLESGEVAHGQAQRAQRAQGASTSPKNLPSLSTYFPGRESSRSEVPPEALDAAIVQAVRDGYLAVDVGRYLGLSKAAISKRSSTYALKENLFRKLRDKGLFWSYRKDLRYEEAGGKLLIEHCLKYADFDDIKLCFDLFGKRMVKKVWEQRMKSDGRFIKTNLMLARLFFGMNVESNYFKEAAKEHGRFKKPGMFAS